MYRGSQLEIAISTSTVCSIIDVSSTCINIADLRWSIQIFNECISHRGATLPNAKSKAVAHEKIIIERLISRWSNSRRGSRGASRSSWPINALTKAARGCIVEECGRVGSKRDRVTRRGVVTVFEIYFTHLRVKNLEGGHEKRGFKRSVNRLIWLTARTRLDLESREACRRAFLSGKPGSDGLKRSRDAGYVNTFPSIPVYPISMRDEGR